MEFDAEQKLIAIQLVDGAVSTFATEKIDSISFVQPSSGSALTYTDNFNVAFDSKDKNNYSEETETILDDESEEAGDFIENFSASKIMTITYSETGVTVSPDLLDQVNYVIDGTNLIISSSRSKMAYRVQGSCSKGSLKIYSEKKFQLALSGLTLTNPQGPAINIQSGKTVYVTLPDGKKNVLCDGEVYADAPYSDKGEPEDQKGTFFSEGQLIFSGTGTLNVTSYGGHGICCDDYIRIRSGNINILYAAKDGINTNELFRVGRTAESAPTIKITADGDGIDCGKGNIFIEAGNITVNTVDDGIVTSYEEMTDAKIDPSIVIAGGFIKVTTTGEKGMAIKSNANYTQTGGIVQAKTLGNGSKAVNCEKDFEFTGGKLTAIIDGAISSDGSSAAGIKSTGNCTITSGVIGVNCTGVGAKAINADGNVAILDDANVTLLSTGKNYNEGTDDKKSRAVSALSYAQNGGTVLMKSYDKAISTTEGISLSAGILNAFSVSDYALSVAAIQTGGWMLTKDGKE